MAGQLEALKKNVWQNDELSATYQPGNLAHENTWGGFSPSDDGSLASVATCQHYTSSIKKDVYEVFLIAW